MEAGFRHLLASETTVEKPRFLNVHGQRHAGCSTDSTLRLLSCWTPCWYFAVTEGVALRFCPSPFKQQALQLRGHRQGRSSEAQGAAWHLQQQLRHLITELCFLKTRSVSGPCFAAEGLPGAFQAPRGLISCERPAHLPRAGDLLVPAEQAVSVPWSFALE